MVNNLPRTEDGSIEEVAGAGSSSLVSLRKERWEEDGGFHDWSPIETGSVRILQSGSL